MIRGEDRTIRRLSTHEVRDVYRKYLKNDFPRNERRPLWNILSMRRRRQYECFGVFCGGGLVCYAFFVTLVLDGKRCCLLDYFAVLSEHRGSGIGSWFLSQLGKCMRTADMVLAEVEDPDREDDPEKKTVQERRLSFYLKNGLRDTAVRVETFGVPYRILEAPLARRAPGAGAKAAAAAAPEEIRSAYRAFYRRLLVNRAFDRYIRFV